MLTIAYLANQFPATVEPYVGWEIQELRRRGIRVIPSSARRLNTAHWTNKSLQSGVLCLQPTRVITLLRALGFAVRRGKRISPLIARILFKGNESPKLRLKALLHTWLGAYYALLLRGRGVDHIHAHHGYFASWIAMVAAKLLGVSFSLTLHGSDLLVDGVYLDAKLTNCKFCVTISEHNRRYIFDHLPATDARKVFVSRLGVDVEGQLQGPRVMRRNPARTLTLLAVGRLHAVKDHAFLVRACARLRDRGVDFECAIAGNGPERKNLELIIQNSQLQNNLRLLGHVPPAQLDTLYRNAGVVVLTSQSEGIPLVLMEAMARGGIVLAPAITGIPEIVIPGKTGFLYIPGSIEDFVAKVLSLQDLLRTDAHPAVSRLDWIRHAARVQVWHNFNRRKNLRRFGDWFLRRVANHDSVTEDWSSPHEDFVLQQI